ncbi:CRISPR-associated endonuclease Cas2 [Candidatus Poribacteria bacterium]|nr:CRISPR-associated endonuclease Cas2 [Candidatus Poribacteria bacterium]
MHTYVIYDIVKDRIRKKIADICLDYGLKRIQYSAFLGDINTTRRRALEEKLTEQLGKAEGKIEILSVCAKDYDKRTIIEETGK